MSQSALPITLHQAVNSAPKDALHLQQLAAKQRAFINQADSVTTSKQWQADMACYTYLSHIAINLTDIRSALAEQETLLAELGALFYHAASLPHQPWYQQFLEGEATDIALPCPPSVGCHQQTVAHFDFGFKRPRYYQQCVSLVKPDNHSRVIVMQSVEGRRTDTSSKEAYTLSPNGEVLVLNEGVLHWHHICTTPGPSIFSGHYDRWFMNALRWLRLDQAERNTYREEAHTLRDWINDKPAYDAFLAGHRALLQTAL
jgi:hypothetical protein